VRNGSLWRHSRHWLNLRPVYALGQWFLENLPLPVGYGITRGVIEVAYRYSPAIRSALEANVRHVLRHTGPGRPAAEIEREVASTVHRIFVNRGVWFADLSVLAGCRQTDGLFRFETEGNWPALTRALSTGRGVILASAHLGNWFGGGVAVARHGIPVRSVMYRNHAGDVMDRKVARRGNVRQTFVDPDPWAMMEIVRALRQGEAVAMLVDKPWDSRAVEVPFFGKPARFPLGPVRIARLAEVPLFPAFCLVEGPRRYHAVLCDPIEVRGPDPEEAEREALGRLARVLEGFVAPNLHLWFNFTPVWGAP
jgi:KDO2-lipid IV(A) lauroyltransferase